MGVPIGSVKARNKSVQSVADSSLTAWNTPTVEGDVLYARGGDGEVRCISVKDGKTVWTWPKKGEAPFGRNPRKLDVATQNGCAASITLCDDELLLTGANYFGCSILVALDRKTGERLWETDDFRDWGFGARNHVVLDVGGKKIIITHEKAIDVKTGTKVCEFNSASHEPHQNEWCSAFEGNRYFSSVSRPKPDLSCPPGKYESDGVGERIECLTFERQDDGSITCTSTWKWFTNKLGRTFGKRFSGPLLVNGFLYVFMGWKGDSDHLICLDAATGKETWPEVVTPPHLYVSCPIGADGKIFYVNDKGLLVMIAADPKQYRLLGTAKIIGNTWSSPALSDGCLFVRDDSGALKCLDLRKQ